MARPMLNALTGGERNVVAPVRLPDPALEFWAEIYRANPRLAARGLSFEQFIADPEFHLHGSARYQLAPIEQQVMRKALARSVTVIDGGRRIEKPRHHRWPRGRSAFFGKPEEQ